MAEVGRQVAARHETHPHKTCFGLIWFGLVGVAEVADGHEVNTNILSQEESCENYTQ